MQFFNCKEKLQQIVSYSTIQIQAEATIFHTYLSNICNYNSIEMKTFYKRWSKRLENDVLCFDLYQWLYGNSDRFSKGVELHLLINALLEIKFWQVQTRRNYKKLGSFCYFEPEKCLIWFRTEKCLFLSAHPTKCWLPNLNECLQRPNMCVWITVDLEKCCQKSSFQKKLSVANFVQIIAEKVWTLFY